METLSNQNSNGNVQLSRSDVELTLWGIDKKWVRWNGSWVDKSLVQETKVIESNEFEIEGSRSKWWQFWKRS